MAERSRLTGVNGPWPFVTRGHYWHAGKRLIWHSRGHRKGLDQKLPMGATTTWQPQSLNLWIGFGFAIGSFLFIVGSVLSLWPDLAQAFALSASQVGGIYFSGSVFFTLAAYLQLFQAANASLRMPGCPPPDRLVWLGWHPRKIGWLSSALQFLGTLLFNVSTFMAMGALGNWVWQDMTIWTPDIVGSVLFLLSGYLAFIEVCHKYWAWRWRDFPWWVAWVNLLGCIAFMASAIYAFVPYGGVENTSVALSTGWTLYGAIGFFAGSSLMLIESRASFVRRN